MTRNGILRTSPNVWCLKLAILFKLKTGERLGRVGFTVLTGPALYVEVGQIRRWKHSEPECEISGTASYRYSWSFTSIYHGLVLCQSQYHYLYPTMLDTGADCRWLRIGIHLNLHPYQQRLDRISFVYSDLSGHMVMVVVVGECFPLTVIRTKYQLAGLSDCLHQPAVSSVQK